MFGRLVVLPLLAVSSACSQRQDSAEIHVGSAWVRPTLAAGKTSAAYVSIENLGAGDDRLQGASAEVAGRVTLHASSNDGGIARMRPLPDGLPIRGGETVRLEPGGYHLMLEQLDRPLRAGESISIMLTFDRSGNRVVQAQVANGLADSGQSDHGTH